MGKEYPDRRIQSTAKIALSPFEEETPIEIEGARVLDFAAPLAIGDKRWGSLRVGVPTAPLETAQAQLLRRIVGFTLVFALGALGLFSGRLRLAWSEEQLNYRPQALSRRAFFQKFRFDTSSAVRHTLNRVADRDKTQVFGLKRLPAGRDMLLQVLPLFDEPFRGDVTARFFPTLKFGQT